MINLKKYRPAELSILLNKMDAKQFFMFISQLKPIRQLDLTTYPKLLQNLNKILEKLQHPEIRGSQYDCKALSKIQLQELNCYTPNILKYGSIKKIGAESANGIVFLIRIGNFKLVLKTAVLYDADPLDYEFHIQKILNPIRQYVPNYSYGYFYFNCNVTDNLKMKEIILNDSIAAVQGSYNINVDDDEDLEDYRTPSKKTVPINKLQNKESLAQYVIKRLQNLGNSHAKHVNLYNELMNSFASLEITPLCQDAPKPLESKRKSERLNKIYRKQAEVQLGVPNLFIATELTDVTESLDDYVENLGIDGRNGQTLINILLQTYCALQAGGDRYKFTHYDLHAGNVLLTKLPEPVIFIYYFPYSSMPFVPIYTEYLVTLIDFGRSYVKGKQMYFDIEDPDGKNKDWLFNDDEDSNIAPNRYNPCFDMARLTYFVFAIKSTQKDLLLIEFFDLFNDFFEDSMNDDQDSLIENYGENSEGIIISKPLDFIKQVYNEGTYFTEIPVFPNEIYFFNTPNINGRVNYDKNILQNMDKLVRNKNYYWTQDKILPFLNQIQKFKSQELIGGKKKKSKIKKYTKKGGRRISQDKYKALLNKMQKLKPKKTIKSNKFMNYGKHMFETIKKENQNPFQEEEIVNQIPKFELKSFESMDVDMSPPPFKRRRLRGGKKKRKRKQKGGIKLNHDLYKNVETIQQY